MKKLIAALLLSTFAIATHAATKCERMPSGSLCCWDTVAEGPFRPLSCW